uniref:Uncharacterized protein n=1 Tax=Magallana gigas TaxID=29159 RepID=A0A8W8NTQ1_MAGGI
MTDFYSVPDESVVTRDVDAEDLVLTKSIHQADQACALPSRRDRLGRSKAGTCPVSTIITTCECRPEFIRCNSDRDCPENQKCCSEGCGCRTSCVPPVQEHYSNPIKHAPPTDICSMPEDRGLCLGAIPRWWYNRVTNRCQSFIYGGCRGNQNNFKTLIECANRCRRNSYRPGDGLRI